MWKRFVLIIMILCMDNFLIFCLFVIKYFFCVVVKKNMFFWGEILFYFY